MQMKEVKANGARVLLTANELLMISNALNEVCNGLDLPEFATRMGVERAEVLSLLKAVGAIYDEIAIHSDATPVQ